MAGRSHIALVGLMGTGKSTIGELVAKRLDLPFVDGDDELTARTGRSAHEIAEQDGIDALHALEAEVALDVLDREDPAVFASSASTILSPAVRDALRRRATVVWLHAPTITLAKKLKGKPHRPDLGPDAADALGRMADERSPLFAELADVDYDTFGRDGEEVAEAVVDALA
jgi:shikimate kinase